MTVQSTVNKITHLVSDIGQTEYIYDFRVDEADHVIVYLNDVEQSPGDYIVNDLGSLTGGTITISFTTALNDQLLILREMPLTQLLDYITYGKFPSATHEKGLDYGVMIDQQLQEAYSRAMRFPVYDDVDPILPSPQDQYALVWEDNALVNKLYANSGGEVLIHNDHDLNGRHLVYDSVEDLRSSGLTPFNGQLMRTLGVESPDDGGEGLWFWHSTSVETDNTGLVVKIDSILTGRAKRLNVKKIDVKWFGDTTSDLYAAFVLMVSAVKELPGHRQMVIPAQTGGYEISEQVDIDFGDFTLEINADIESTKTTKNSMINIFGIENTEIENIFILGASVTLDGNGENVTGYVYSTSDASYDVIRVEWANNIYINGVHCTYGLVGALTLYRTRVSNIDDCEFSYSQHDNGFSITWDNDLIEGDAATYSKCIVQNSEAHHNADYGFTSFGSSGNIFSHLKSYNNGLSDIGGGGYSSEDSGGTYYETLFDNLFTYCIATNNKGNGFKIAGSGVTIDKHCVASGATFVGTDPNHFKGNGYFVSQGKNNNVSGEVYDNQWKGLHLNGVDDTAGAKGIEVYIANTLLSDLYTHDNVEEGIYGQGIDSLKMTNITSESNDDKGIYVYNVGALYNEGAGLVEIAGMTIKTNDSTGLSVDSVDRVKYNNILAIGNAATSGFGVQCDNVTTLAVLDDIVATAGAGQTTGINIGSGTAVAKLTSCYGEGSSFSIRNLAVRNLGEYGFSTLANVAEPSVVNGRNYLTGGTTTITDFGDGATGQEITIVAEHSITIQDTTHIHLDGGVNFDMVVGDTLKLIQKADTYWYQTGGNANS